MKTLFYAGALVAGSVHMAGAATVDGSTGYLLSMDGTSLTIIDDLGVPTDTRQLDLSGGVLEGISYRPRTGQLYGYSVGSVDSETDQIFEIDVTSGVLTDNGANTFSGVDGISQSSRIGFDFNNGLDAARIVSKYDDNIVFFPSDTASNNSNAGRVIDATDLFYTVGDVNEGVDPSVFANAYTNAVDGEVATETLQYAIDAETNSLLTLANNAGNLSTIGALGFDVTTEGGFEILSDEQGDNLGLAVLTEEGGRTGLFSIDLETGEATLIGDLGNRDYASFAAQTGSIAPVPLPASALLLLAGLGGLAVTRRRKAA